MPLISSITAFIFAVIVLDQFFARRRPYQLIWAIGLFMYFIVFAGFLRSREVFGFYRFPLIHGFKKVPVG
ncbi:MAG: hypothetical protein ABIH70_00935 [Chloroflexota bacterium]